ncbi:hypothetical protein FG386_001356 [Cryptosporidium ryanae]|uniref:uncharacterized protein n=1 Tax=Cryptosporidium ryanae TaxID=515981 RepID=UPI003519FC8F|nr:hypothetical protein FG386_001356 [Cryptosporidium ryanae]
MEEKSKITNDELKNNREINNNITDTSDGGIMAAFKNIINDERNRGIIYISRIPPKMGPHYIREVMSSFGEVDRIFLRPEDKSKHEQRVKMRRGNYIRYIDGWVEFKDKKIAKSVASSLNNTIIGGKKRHNVWRDDMWCIKYLSNFKWHNLTEHNRYLKSVRKAKLQARLSLVQKENNYYLQQVEKAKRMEKNSKKQNKNQIDSKFNEQSEKNQMNFSNMIHESKKSSPGSAIESNESKISKKSLGLLL